MRNKQMTNVQKRIFIGCLLFSATTFLGGLSVRDTVNTPTEVHTEVEKKVIPNVLAGVIPDLQPVKVVTEKPVVKANIKEPIKVQPVKKKYYQIPEKYKATGADLTEETQDFLREICEERGLDFYIVLAQIETESGYRSYAKGDSGRSKGYMQVQERWNRQRMQDEGVTDLYNPTENIKVGTNYLAEVYKKYGDWNKALMCYNMGENKAEELWRAGKYSSEYSRTILTRAQEIKQELEQG